MAKPKKPKKKPLRYFYYRGNLCKKIRLNRSIDVIVAWNYPEGRTERYVYSDVRKNGEHAFKTSEVMKMLNRVDRAPIMKAIKDGEIKGPQHTYGLDENRNLYAYYWSEEAIMEAHEFLLGIHRGRPRKDGHVTRNDMPTVAELRAMIRQGTVFYVKVGDDFVPTWQAEKF